jgi:hypothetical protein
LRGSDKNKKSVEIRCIRVIRVLFEDRTMLEIAEIVQTIEHVQSSFEDLTVRGLRSAGPEQLATLSALREEFERIGAGHLAGRIASVVEVLRGGEAKAAAALLRAQASLRVFERVLTLQVAAQTLSALLESTDAEDES